MYDLDLTPKKKLRLYAIELAVRNANCSDPARTADLVINYVNETGRFSKDAAKTAFDPRAPQAPATADAPVNERAAPEPSESISAERHNQNLRGKLVAEVFRYNENPVAMADAAYRFIRDGAVS